MDADFVSYYNRQNLDELMRDEFIASRVAHLLTARAADYLLSKDYVPSRGKALIAQRDYWERVSYYLHRLTMHYRFGYRNPGTFDPKREISDYPALGTKRPRKSAPPPTLVRSSELSRRTSLMITKMNAGKDAQAIPSAVDAIRYARAQASKWAAFEAAIKAMLEPIIAANGEYKDREGYALIAQPGTQAYAKAADLKKLAETDPEKYGWLLDKGLVYESPKAGGLRVK